MVDRLLRRIRLWYAAFELREAIDWSKRSRKDWERYGR